jgi:hypothetical protein
MRDGAWRLWWTSDAAPAYYDSSRATLAPLVEWRATSSGIDLGELRISGAGEAWRVRLVVARVDPARVRFDPVPRRIGQDSWTIDSMSADALLAVSGGQFETTHTPWGWLVLDGTERLPPIAAPLGMALAIDASGRVSLMTPGDISAARAGRTPFPRIALQSYPTALVDDSVPFPLQASGRGINVAHRDGRLGVCTLRDGRVLVALTRFDALHGEAAELPFGVTVPEMAALMGGLGCVRALLLDGGISRQFGVRAAAGDSLLVRHKGWRSIPMGLEVRPR